MPFTLGDFRELTDHLPDDTELTAANSLDDTALSHHVSDSYVEEDEGVPRVVVVYNEETMVIS